MIRVLTRKNGFDYVKKSLLRYFVEQGYVVGEVVHTSHQGIFVKGVNDNLISFYKEK